MGGEEAVKEVSEAAAAVGAWEVKAATALAAAVDRVVLVVADSAAAVDRGGFGGDAGFGGGAAGGRGGDAGFGGGAAGGRGGDAGFGGGAAGGAGSAPNRSQLSGFLGMPSDQGIPHSNPARTNNGSGAQGAAAGAAAANRNNPDYSGRQGAAAGPRQRIETTRITQAVKGLPQESQRPIAIHLSTLALEVQRPALR